MKTKPDKLQAYDRVVEELFFTYWEKGAIEVVFTKDNLIDAIERVGLRIKNTADIIYTYRSRRKLPAKLLKLGDWIIASRGSGKYAFVPTLQGRLIEIPSALKIHPVPWAVPEIVAANLARDEQGLLTIARYNRLLDVFTGLACFHLQSHVRTHIKGHGQVEIDDLYVGVDKEGIGYVLPVEGKEEGESLGRDKAVALTKFARFKFPNLRCRPIAIARQADEVFACIEFEPTESVASVAVLEIRRYRLVSES